MAMASRAEQARVLVASRAWEAQGVGVLRQVGLKEDQGRLEAQWPPSSGCPCFITQAKGLLVMAHRRVPARGE